MLQAVNQGEHSAILSTIIKLPFVIKTFVKSVFKWPFYTVFTVLCHTHKIYTCKYFAIWSKYTHVSKSIFNLRSHDNSVHISILKVTLDQLYL